MVAMDAQTPPVVILGRPFENFGTEFRKSVHDLVWCTYRTGFEPIPGTSMLTDSGWGCMIRTGQMIVAEALLRSQNDRKQVVDWVRDEEEAPLSLHRISAMGSEFGKEIGQWHTPSITALSIHRLIDNHPEVGLCSSIAQDLQLYKNEIQEKLKENPCLVWLPMRLGISELNSIYVNVIKQLLMCPLTVGLGGGRPKSSYFFFGFAGDDLLYLDPHITRPSIGSDQSEEALQSYHGDSAKKMPITAIDPCFVAAFLLKDFADFEAFEKFIGDLKDPSGQALVSLGAPQKEATLVECEDSDFVDIS